MRSIFCFFLVFILALGSPKLYAQSSASINEGETQLPNKWIQLKNKNLSITPIIAYSSDKPGELNIELKIDLEDKNGVIISNEGDYIYLISDWDKLLTHFKSNKNIVDRDPKLEKAIEEGIPIKVLQGGEQARIDDFKSGFNGFRDMSAPIKAYIDPSGSQEIIISFNFVHIQSSGNKKKIKEGPKQRTWNFRLPQTGGATIPTSETDDCEKLKSTYAGKIKDIIKNQNLAYFHKQLSNPNANIDRLKAEFKTFKDDIIDAKSLRKVISFNQALGECGTAKQELLAELDHFISEEDGIASVEQKIASFQSNICNNYENKYAKRVKALKLDRDLAYFNNQLEKPSPDIIAIEAELKATQKELTNAKALLKEITNDSRAAKCNDIKKDFVNRIGNVQKMESDLNSIASRINKAEDELKENKDQAFARYFELYNAYLREAQNQFDDFEESLPEREGEILARYEKNSSRILFLKEMRTRKTENIDSLEEAQNLLQVCERENKINISAVEEIYSEIGQLKTDVELYKTDCKSEFTSISKEEGEKKAKPLINNFTDLLKEINVLVRRIDALHENIIRNNTSIFDLSNVFDPGKVNVKQKIINRYDSLFTISLEEIAELEEEYQSIQEAFESKRYSKSYYSWTKRRLYNRTSDSEEELNELAETQDTVILARDIDFDKYNINVYQGEINEFNQRESGLRPKFEHLGSEIDNSTARSFPYVYLILGIIMLVILGFGGRIYYNA